MTKKMIAGNWKMNGDLASALALTRAIAEGVNGDPRLAGLCDFVICPPFVHLARVRANLNGAAIMIGAQDCSERDNGAFTGDVSAAMLADCGCGAVILGHSERRQFHKESDALINAKAMAAHRAGLLTIICVGELEAERAAGTHFDVVAAQLKGSIPISSVSENTVIAYEPVWAIGTGKTAMPEDVRAMHAFIRKTQPSLRILYGGSVKAENAAELLATENVDGALIGGASLKAEQYLAIAKSV